MTLHTDYQSPGPPGRPEDHADQATLALFREFFRISPDGIVLIDNNDRVLKANPAFLEMFGYPLEEVIGQAINDLIVDPAVHEEASELSHQALDGKEVRHEGLRRRRNGDLINVEIFGTPLMLDRRQVGIYAIYRDITARRQAEDLLEQSETKHRSIIESMHDGYFEIDLAGNLIFSNDALTRIMGFRSEVPEALNTFEYFDAETGSTLYEQFNRIYRTGRADSGVAWHFTTPDGELRHVEASVSLIHNREGEPVGFRGVIRNITERVQALEALRRSEELFRLVTENTGQLVYDYDLRTGGIHWSGAIGPVLGIAPEQAGEFDIDDWIERLHPDDRDQSVQMLEETSKSGEPYRVEYRLRRGHGDYIHIEDRGSYLRDTEDRPVRLIGTMTDITERRRQEKRIAYQASHDALTGLSNRYRFEETGRRLADDARDFGRTHTLLYLDLDQFKVVNDTCGHHAGDELLRQLSGHISQLVRRDDVLARLGGDEFGLLLADCDTRRGCEIARNIIDVVNAFEFAWEEHRFNVGVSIGLVAIDGRLGFNELLKAADQACYVAKDHGRNCCHVYHEQDRLLRQRSAELQAVADVNAAIDEDRFELHRQRIVGLQESDSGQCFEILLRMRNRDGDLIPPGEFIRGAERYNRMTAIDRWVVENSLSRIGQLCAAGRLGDRDWFSINLSGSSLHDPDFGEFVRSLLATGEVDPGHVCFEVTESSAIAHYQNAIKFLQSLRALGCRIMLDDFGSGLSSFSYLKMLPVDFIKVDGSLIRDITRSPFDQAIVRAIDDVAHVLGKPLIAEHVENAATLDKLREIGVDFAQGFYLHRPEPWVIET